MFKSVTAVLFVSMTDPLNLLYGVGNLSKIWSA